jgi:hypothetical protein
MDQLVVGEEYLAAELQAWDSHLDVLLLGFPNNLVSWAVQHSLIVCLVQILPSAVALVTMGAQSPLHYSAFVAGNWARGRPRRVWMQRRLLPPRSVHEAPFRHGDGWVLAHSLHAEEH